MLKIEKTVLPSAEQWKIVIEGMRNPMNSWGKMDTENENLGEADHALASKLAEGGSVHAKYRRMLPVWVTITAPVYWWKEADTYKVGTVRNSCSTMHKVTENEFTLDDFSCEHLWSFSQAKMKEIIQQLNVCRNVYNDPNTSPEYRKQAWWQIIQLLPSSYNQKSTLLLNYEVLAAMYRDRKNHKLQEWHTLCGWIEKLPNSDLITSKTV